MNPTFAINFRREAYRLERTRTRRRAVSVGTWVAYFGVLALVLGLYGLNCGSLLRRARLVDDQIQRLRSSAGTAPAWKPGAADVVLAERALDNPRRWRARLARLAAVLPPNARILSLVVNPDNLAAPDEQEHLLIVGELRPRPGQDGMHGATAVAEALHSDPVFGAQYRAVLLLDAQVGDAGAPTRFRIECR